ncbi:MAG: metallophosphoesterase [Anaerolineaceae bacterium]
MEEIEKINPNNSPFIIGVVSDTHVPDRVNELHPFLLSELKNQKVDMIFHAGDISVRTVLTALNTIAPVRAVSGNRDFLLGQELPTTREFEIFGSQVILTHGHMGLKVYWRDKFSFITRGYSFERYQQRFDSYFKQARVIVFGHTHQTENRWVNDRLYFNPGVSGSDTRFPVPKFGILKFYEDGRIESCVIQLTGARLHNRRWEITN